MASVEAKPQEILEINLILHHNSPPQPSQKSAQNHKFQAGCCGDEQCWAEDTDVTTYLIHSL